MLGCSPCPCPCLPSLINARAGSPAVSAPHVSPPVSAHGLPTAPAQPRLATTSASQRITVLPIPTEKPQLLAIPHSCGLAQPLPNHPAGPTESHGGIKTNNRPRKPINLIADPQHTLLAKQVPTVYRNQAPQGHGKPLGLLKTLSCGCRRHREA